MIRNVLFLGREGTADGIADVSAALIYNQNANNNCRGPDSVNYLGPARIRCEYVSTFGAGSKKVSRYTGPAECCCRSVVRR